MTLTEIIMDERLEIERHGKDRFGRTLYELVDNAPTQIQDYVEKDYELRVTVRPFIANTSHFTVITPARMPNRRAGG